MQLYIADYCYHCNIYLESKADNHKREELRPYQLEDLEPQNVIAFDVATLPWSTKSYRYFLVIVDLFSKYLEAIPKTDQTADIIKQAIIDGWIKQHAKPKIAISDQVKNIDDEVINNLVA